MAAIKPLIVIVGETASGKSSLALQLAQQFEGEIINADSWNVYKTMNIGTAKPSTKERELVPHHLIDIIDPDNDYTAALFKQDALRVIEEIHSRNKVPIMVGGNGLYVDSVIYDYSFLPPSTKAQRKELNSKSINELLELIDKHQYNLVGIDTRNKRRLIRLIESRGQHPTKGAARTNTLVLGLQRSRPELRKRIEQRVETMFRVGLRHEVEALIKQYDWELESMKGIGYREFKDYYEGKASMTQTKHKIINSSLKLAKRQRTWFKRSPDIHWVDDAEQAEVLVNNFLNN